jgi:hypothetical protein
MRACDSKATDSLLDRKDKGKCFYAGSVYTGESQKKMIESRQMENQVKN